VPGRSLHRHRYELPEVRRSLGVQPLSSPCHPLEVLADLGQQMFDMTLARCLIGLHSIAPYRAPMAISAFWSNADVFAPTMLETTLPTPRYVIHQSEWHFGLWLSGYRLHLPGERRLRE
jgi:hypothetical protein